MFPRVAHRAGVPAIAIIALAWFLNGSASRAQSGRLILTPLLDDYSAGRFDAAMRAVSNADDETVFRLLADLPTHGRRWIDATPEDRRRRLLVAASLVVEVEHVLIERGFWTMSWSADGLDLCELLAKVGSDGRGTVNQCLLNWAYALLTERGFGDGGEHAWVLAAAALIEGVHDWRFLHVPPGANPRDFVVQIRRDGLGGSMPDRFLPAVRGLVDRALERFPDDPVLKFHEALAVASRFNVTIEGMRFPSDPMTNLNLVNPGIVRLAAPPREDAVGMLAALRTDPTIGAEARLRLGYVLWATGNDSESRTELEAAVTATADPDLRYLARFLLGWTAMTRDDFTEAKRQLALALEIRPDSQSAALALATLHLKEGEATRAYDLADASFAKRPNDDDPWRLFLDGHHPYLPALIAQLRSKTR